MLCDLGELQAVAVAIADQIDRSLSESQSVSIRYMTTKHARRRARQLATGKRVHKVIFDFLAIVWFIFKPLFSIFFVVVSLAKCIYDISNLVQFDMNIQ